MSAVRFRTAARVPHGVTAEQVVAELDDIARRFGRRSVDAAVKAVLSEPDRYPALRAFGPEDAETAFRDAIREGVEYAARVVVKVDEAEPEREVRLLHIVHDSDEAVWATLPEIAKSEPMQRELVRRLQRDAETFTRRMQDILAELAAIIGA